MFSRVFPPLVLLALAGPSVAFAHVSIISGPGFGGTSQEITFGVGHGCDGADTYRVRVEIPATITSVRAENSEFGRATVERNAAGLVTAVTWQKAEADLLESDDNYYKLTVRIKVPDAPFTRLFLPAHQTCKKSDGTTSVVDWTALEEGTDAEPAPTLVVLPKRQSGWNRVTVPVDVPDLGAFFADALIVWKGTAAYSANTETTALIGTTPGVTALTSLGAGDQVWVRY